MTLAILGLGTMASAILTGALDSGAVRAGEVTATTRSAASAAAARERFPGVTVLAAEDDAAANSAAVRGADVVLLGVKPKDLVATVRGVADALAAEAVVVSVAAGVTAATIAGALRPGQPLVRTMPNTPLTVGSGVVGLAPAATATAAQVAAVESLFVGSGVVVPVAEEQLPAVVAAAGSAPAYVFLLAEAITAHARAMGLEPASAEAMAAATVKGAGLMLERGEQTAEQLRRAVMSPKGTTERAVAALQDGGFMRLVADAMDAAADRDREMGRELA